MPHFSKDPVFAHRARDAYLGECKISELMVDDEMFAVFIRGTTVLRSSQPHIGANERLAKRGVFTKGPQVEPTSEFIAFVESNQLPTTAV